jgi:hypothetical protein
MVVQGIAAWVRAASQGCLPEAQKKAAGILCLRPENIPIKQQLKGKLLTTGFHKVIAKAKIGKAYVGSAGHGVHKIPLHCLKNFYAAAFYLSSKEREGRTFFYTRHRGGVFCPKAI